MWQPIETAPKDGSVIMGYSPDPVHLSCGSYQVWTWPDGAALSVLPIRWHSHDSHRTDEESGWYAPFNHFYSDYDGTDVFAVAVEPTHWQPIPEPPIS